MNYISIKNILYIISFLFAIIAIISILNTIKIEEYTNEYKISSPDLKLKPPYKYKRQYLSYDTEPVNMLSMKAHLLEDGYRFQNSIKVDNDNFTIDKYPDVFIKGSGKFNNVDGHYIPPRKTYTIDNYLQYGGGNGVNQTSLKDIQNTHIYKIMHNDNYHIKDISYPNKIFSWGDIINRFSK